MRIRLLDFWDRLRSGYWFVPTLIALAAVALAFGLVTLDSAGSGKWIEEREWSYAGGAEGASAVLSTIAGSMITIAGVIFSLTLLTLSLASTQFGPRILRNFLRDLPNQIVLGTFVGTFLYCLLVLRTLRYAEEDGFVPHLSVTVGVVLAVVSIGVLIYFIHHISVSIQVDKVTVSVSKELTETIDRLFPAKFGEEKTRQRDAAQADLPADFESNSCEVIAGSEGYVQVVNAERLLELATERDLVIRLERRPGDYAFAPAPLARIWPADRVDDELTARVNDAFARGAQRTPIQDVEFAVNQLVEIAVRALSPGINDPFTAVTCVDRLGSALCRLADREIPSPYRYDEEGKLRLIAYPTGFPKVADAALSQIRHYGRSSAAVSVRMLEIVATVLESVHRPADRDALQLHADMIVRAGRESLSDEHDRREMELRYERIRRA